MSLFSFHCNDCLSDFDVDFDDTDIDVAPEFCVFCGGMDIEEETYDTLDEFDDLD